MESGKDLSQQYPIKGARREETNDGNNMAVEAQSNNEGKAVPKLNFAALPTELHLHIASYLTYPDALSLKHTNQYFHSFVNTGIDLKIEWLIERRRLHLDCPHDKRCELGSDMRFCRGSVRLLMKRRREHTECDYREGGRGCLVFGTKICMHRKMQDSWAYKFKTTLQFVAIGGRRAWPWWTALILIGIGIALKFMMREKGMLLGENAAEIADYCCGA